MSPITRFILVSLVFHLLYTASIFDIYFTSPVVHPSRRFSPEDSFIEADKFGSTVQAPAERLVLIVGDGLRADTLFKHHDISYLPSWAADEIATNGKISINTALTPVKSWTGKTNTQVKAETFDAAPYLRNVIEKRGAWGISHTRVPTESRPGHVALIAGMYEDVSAVTKGWKLNPVSFDSLLNQSSHAFSFGSPDILPMFATGATPGKVDMQSYAEEEEDFTSDASNLDIWVLDRLRELLTSAKTNNTLADQIRAPKTVFFLHLLGLDTTGHTYRPKSAEYVGNLMVVDAIVAETERLLSAFYGPEEAKKTAYIFSADHGMSHKGNHGDGEPDNTRTPLVAWGAGIRKPRGEEKKQNWRVLERENDDYYQAWGSLDRFWREDVEQADITPLMSALIGANMPANSEGRLPLDYLDITQEQAARAMLANALEVLEVYRVKHEQRSERMLRYVPFSQLPSEEGTLPGSSRVEIIKTALSRAEYEKVIGDSEKLIKDALEGAAYLQTYDWLMLVSIVTIGYVGSMLYGLLFLLRHYVLDVSESQVLKERSPGLPFGRIVVGTSLSSLWAKFAYEQSPVTYYLYAGFAAFFWIRLINERKVFVLVWNKALSYHSERSQNNSKTAVLLSISIRVVLGFAALELMVFGYLNRLAWTAGFIFLGLIWPAAGMIADVKARHELLLILWFFCCGFCSLFTVGNVEKEESIPYLIASGLLFLLAGAAIIRWSGTFMEVSKDGNDQQAETQARSNVTRTKKVLTVQLIVLLISALVTASSSASLQAKRGLPRLNQIVAWAVLLICLTFPFVTGLKRKGVSQPPSQRLMVVIFAFAPVFVLLSIRDETLFFGCYTMTLIIWAKLEAGLFEERLYQRNVAQHAAELTNGNTKASSNRIGNGFGRALEKEDVRIAICFLFFLHVGFFGTGNIASISSFYLSPVYRLIPIFSPFLMAALLILKIMVPFIVLASVFQMLCLTPPHTKRTSGKHIRKTGYDLAGPPLFGAESVGGLGLRDAYSLVLLACIFTDVLALNFLLTVQTKGSWLEIGQSITHFAMSNLLQVFILALSALADVVVGRGGKVVSEELGIAKREQ
ncbi:hypothetical protein L7F22_003203 [Adiantum nelumboides]|nr:hypothetical protein [Adiantum nelumboides]